MRFVIPTISLVLVVFGTGCDSIFTTLCPASSEPAIEVEVFDTVTGVPAAEGATGVLIDGAYSDSLIVIGSNADGEEYLLGGAYDRPGRYDVRVEKEGYQVWERQEVRVRRGDCGPRTVRLTAHLERM